MRAGLVRWGEEEDERGEGADKEADKEHREADLPPPFVSLLHLLFHLAYELLILSSGSVHLRLENVEVLVLEWLIAVRPLRGAKFLEHRLQLCEFCHRGRDLLASWGEQLQCQNSAGSQDAVLH